MSDAGAAEGAGSGWRDVVAGSAPRFAFADHGADLVVGCGATDVVRGGVDVLDRAVDAGGLWFVRASSLGVVTAWRPARLARAARPNEILPSPNGRGAPGSIHDDEPRALTLTPNAPPKGRGVAGRAHDEPRAPTLSPDPSPKGRGAQHATPSDDGRAAYLAAVQGALAAIHAGRAEKLVIAREELLALPGPLSPTGVIAGLCAMAGAAYFVDDGDAWFFGASPESLLRLQGGVVDVDCVAGTEPAAGLAGLLTSEKDRREHQAVVDDVVEALGAAGCVDVDAGVTGVITRGPLRHLFTPVRARVGAVPLATLVRHLHPTAATGARPKSALPLVRELERFDRGDYGGFIGVVDDGDARLSVCLRCARVKDGVARVTVGAGVVAGSTPEAEWAETQQKARVLLPTLRGALVVEAP